MKITRMDIQELTLSKQDLREIFAKWARMTAAAVLRERAEEEMMDSGGTFAAMLDSGGTFAAMGYARFSDLLARCDNDPMEVSKWFTELFLKIASQLVEDQQREE